MVYGDRGKSGMLAVRMSKEPSNAPRSPRYLLSQVDTHRRRILVGMGRDRED